MFYKLPLVFLLLVSIPNQLCSQTSPLKRFSLKTEATDIPADSLGTTLFYSVCFEVADTVHLASAVFKLKGINTDSVINEQTFALPTASGVYQTSYFSNGLIKDQHTFFILLGNVKSTEPLKVVTDFTGNDQAPYVNIVPNE